MTAAQIIRLLRSVIAVLIFFIVAIAMYEAFALGVERYPHATDTTLPYVTAVAALASAVTWGLSVIGGLILYYSGLLNSYWNAWLNFFAAGFAALTAGYAAPANTLSVIQRFIETGWQ